MSHENEMSYNLSLSLMKILIIVHFKDYSGAMSAMSLTKAPVPNRLGLGLQQVRFLKRRPAYPQAYKPKLSPLSHPKKDHSSFFQRHMKEWLGPKNMRGEYYRNKYYYPPQDHKPRYIVPDGNTVVLDGKVDVYDNRKVGSNKRDPSLHPFPFNPYCKTASVIPLSLKDKIYEEVAEKGAHVQEVAYKYGIKIPRVEAIIKLRDVEKLWEQKVSYIFFIHCYLDLQIKDRLD